MTERITIIGGGILGSMIAWRLAERGASVTVLDGGAAYEQASEGSLCWLNVASCADEAYATFRISSLRLWHEIAGGAPDCPVRFPGSLVWTGDASASDGQIALMERLGWPVQGLERADLQRLFPGARDLPDHALLAPEEGVAHPGQIVGWARARAAAAGATFIEANVAELVIAGGGVAGASLSDGRTYQSDAVIIAAGRGTARLLESVDIPLPQRPGAGLTGWTAPCAPVVRHAVSSDRLDFWQDDAGRVLFTSPAAKTPENADGMGVEEMVEALASLYPEMAGTNVEHSFARTRPLPEDGFPALGQTRYAGLFAACTHSGMTLAPVIADCLVKDILGAPGKGTPDRYAVNRFAFAPSDPPIAGSLA
ncbi:MAG: FAD-dependent oxidoreductase [Pseudomonadota bacterium]